LQKQEVKDSITAELAFSKEEAVEEKEGKEGALEDRRNLAEQIGNTKTRKKGFLSRLCGKGDKKEEPASASVEPTVPVGDADSNAEQSEEPQEGSGGEVESEAEVENEAEDTKDEQTKEVKHTVKWVKRGGSKIEGKHLKELM
jgi:hypothetical protein